jgi:hypothetical protein
MLYYLARFHCTWRAHHLSLIDEHTEPFTRQRLLKSYR